MSLSKEARIGLLMSVALLIFFVGFYFLKGANIFSPEREYYCFYSNIQGLQKSANVQIRGLNVGRVSGTQLIDNEGVRVVIAIDKKVNLPAGTIASLTSSDLLGTKIIRLDLGNGNGIIAPRSTLPTREEGGVVDNISSQVNPLLTELRTTVSALDTVLASMNLIVGTQNQQAISHAISSIENISRNLETISGALSKENGEISAIVHNTNSISGNLAKNNDTVQQILSNLNRITHQLSRAPLEQTVTGLQQSASQLQDILNKINNDQGSLGLLVNNKDLYNNLDSSLVSMNKLIGYIQAHPGQLIKFSVFGKKKD